MEIWLRYDLRTPSWGPSSSQLSAATLEQVAWADNRGFHTVLLGEHHGTENGYLPSPFTLAAALAARTTSIRLHCMTMLPLLDPIRVAEDVAVLDLVSEGRAEVSVGVAYVPSEFTMFDVPIKERAAIVEEKLPALRAALSGPEFSYRGRPCRVSPLPAQSGGVPIYVAGAAPATARRAARLGDGFFPTVATPELIDLYRSACAELGRPAGRVIDSTGPLAIHVADDPDRAWTQVGPNFLYEMNCYGRWAAQAAAASGMKSPFTETTDVAALRESGVYAVVTPDECVELAVRQRDAGRTLMLSPLAGGIAPDLAWESLELFATRVIPRLLDTGL